MVLYQFALQGRPKMRRYFPRRRDDLLGEVMRKKRHRPDLSGSKQNLSRLAGSGGSVMRIGIRTRAVCQATQRVLLALLFLYGPNFLLGLRLVCRTW